MNRLSMLLKHARRLNKPEPMQFRELWSRPDDCGHRFDVKVLWHQSSQSSSDDDDATLAMRSLLTEVDAVSQPILSALREDEGDEMAPAVVNSAGCVVSLPGGPSQTWHRDGDGRGVINAFCPLLTVSARNGPTQLVPGTHEDINAGRCLGCCLRTYAAQLERGSLLLYDQRVLHRGLANQSNAPRPIAYVTYTVDADGGEVYTYKGRAPSLVEEVRVLQ